MKILIGPVKVGYDVINIIGGETSPLEKNHSSQPLFRQVPLVRDVQGFYFDGG